MAIIQSAASTDLATVDPTMDALHSVLKPDELIGSYQLSATSGAMTLVAAAGPVFSFRYAPGTGQVCVVKRVSVAWNTTTGFTAGQAMGFGMYFARSFIASDTGGTSLTPIIGNSQKYRTGQMVTSQVTDARIATTGALTAGTRTLDTQALGQAYFFAPTTTAGTHLTNTELISYDISDYPLVLQNNEGFVITNQILMGAAGVGTMTVNVEWFETNYY
jgi:hypothetical protein